MSSNSKILILSIFAADADLHQPDRIQLFSGDPEMSQIVTAAGKLLVFAKQPTAGLFFPRFTFI
jgi:hypothetical protein